MVQPNSQHRHPAARHGGPPALATLGELRADGHVYRSVKEEIRQNLLTRMRAGKDRFPGIIGFGNTVLPHLERALLAGHDVILLGERGQGKTRLIRTLAGLLDEWAPAVAGCEINDHPFVPVCARCRRLAEELGEDLPIVWRNARDRYGEKLATPDTSVGDLIGDIDPVKVAEGRTLGDPETVHFGLVPRTNRGIFCLNELPDLAERIQVALLNVLEERDIGVRGYALRLPLDVMLVASANPEDYTNRGRIITPLKDRFGAEIRTHYPLTLDDELSLIRQEAVVGWDGTVPGAELPEHLVEVIARFTRLVRESPTVDSRSRPPRARRPRRYAGPPWPRRRPSGRPGAATVPGPCIVPGAARPAPPPSSRSRGSAICRRLSGRCGAKSSSRSARRAGRRRCSLTCSAGPSRKPSGPGWAAPTCPRCWPSSTAARPWSPVS
jgi:magnesium chelatase subunit I